MARASRRPVSGGAAPPGYKPRGNRGHGAALLVLRVCLGVFMFFFGVEKASWLLDHAPVAAQLSAWAADALPISRWYLDRIIPGAPVFARMVPIGSMLSGTALALGVWTRMASCVALVMVLSLQFGAGSLFRYTYLTDASGLPLVGGLAALIIAGHVKR